MSVVPNIKFISLAYMLNEPKSAKCTNGIYICVCMYVCMCLCVSLFVCVSGMPNIKLVSLAFYVKWAKKYKMQKWYVCVCACACVYLYFCVCDVPFINLVSLVFLPNEPKGAKCKILNFFYNFKNIIDKFIISSLWVAPVEMYNCAKYEGSKFNHIDRRAT